ncbi:MAG: Hpt domain-containing protein [Bryobacterales bacterium]|nr:Hpt domain-containing protein [Bryobacterales bacterium]
MNFRMNPEIATAFIDETKSYFLQILDGLRKWASGDAEALEEPRRLLHTIKGSASMVGLPALAHTSLLFEETVKAAATAPATPGDVRPELIWRALRSFDTYVEGIGNNERRNGELETAIRCLRRVRREAEEGDAEAIQMILEKETGGASTPAAAPVVADAGQMPSEDLLVNFRQEAEDLLLMIGRSLRMLQAKPDDKGILHALRRGVHSLKGAAQSVGQNALAELTHRLEDLLDAMIAGSVAQTAPVTRLVYSAFDTISDLVGGDIDEPAGWERVAILRDSFASLHAEESADGTQELEAEVPDVVPPEFLEVFRPEADEHVTAIASGLRELALHAGDKSALQDVRRAVHTLKGAAGVIGLMKVNSLAHRMEDLLDAVWDGSKPLTAAHQQLLFATSDVLTDLIGEPAKQGEALARRLDLLRAYDALEREMAGVQTLQKRDKAAGGDPGVSIDLSTMPEDNAARPEARPHTSRYVRVPIERLDEMVRLVSELVVSRSTFEQHLGAYRHGVDELRLSLSRIQRLSHRFDTDFQVQALLNGIGAHSGPVANTAGPDKRAEFDTLEFDRYTDLHLVSRDLGETTSDISVGVSQLAHVAGDFDSYVSRLGRLTSDVQDRLMRMRMVPVANLATRLHRTVRVTSEMLGKPVDLILEGEEIETDKTSLEELAGPLEHLLRNAIDHGLETERERLSAGKTGRGQVKVKAYYAGTQVVLEVTDDGRGIDGNAVRRRAVEAGLIGDADAAKLEEEEVYDFLFEPGFSTAAEISEISGRGVGLDVVKTAVQKLKGNIKITSHRGLGTAFHLRLPMSLAILRVLMVKTRGEVYAVPLANVSRILRLESGQLERLGNRQILRLGGRVMPAVRLEEVLGGRARGEEENEELNPRQPVLIVDNGGEQAAILVDELLLAREVVVKTLGSLVRKVRGVTGATILGDGGIVLIVNTGELFEAQRGGHSTHGRAVTMRRPRQARLSGYDVLVVDDSVSVRRVLTNLFQNQGWRPVAARDGMEALEILQAGRRVDAVLLDMEMPRMDGYELLTLLRGQAQFASLPVVMLTSRAAEKHRKKAFELGATDFLVKPYQDEALLAVIRRVVARAEAVAV